MSTPTAVNVKDYRATGDGVTDHPLRSLARGNQEVVNRDHLMGKSGGAFGWLNMCRE